MPVHYDEFSGKPSFYGWVDYTALEHVMGDIDTLPLAQQECSYKIADDQITITENAISQFDGTFTDAKSKVGVEMSPVSCSCGEYPSMVIRYEGTLGDLLHQILTEDS